MWWIYALAACLALTNSMIVFWLIEQENDAADLDSPGRHPRRGPEPPRPRGDRLPAGSRLHRLQRLARTTRTH